MTPTIAELIEKFTALRDAANLKTHDSLAEAGRKQMIGEFVQVLKHEEGSRTGEDSEDVHDMRVATRRIRSTFRLLKLYYPAKAVRRFTKAWRGVAGTLGVVRDLDVQLANLRAFAETLSGDEQAALQSVIAELDGQRVLARELLVDYLDSKAYRRLLKRFDAFLSAEPDEKTPEVAALQVRYALPGLILERLVAVRVYGDDLSGAERETLHALRIECKRLRYAVALFQPVLGATIKEFIVVLKQLQDDLGELNDNAVLRERLAAFPSEATAAYFAHLDARDAELHAAFQGHWAAFNARKTRAQLSNALLALG